MLFELLGSIVLGVAVAGGVALLFRAFGRRTPKWLLPVGAGLAMLGFHIWADYSWFDRTREGLPEHVTVAATFGRSHALQPWTLIVEPIARFSAVDRRSIRTHAEADSLRMAEIYLVRRYGHTGSTLQVYDCDEPRRADVSEDTLAAQGGVPGEADWVAVAADDPVRAAVCRG